MDASSNYTTSSRTTRCTSYDVFLSFRGADTRLGFTDHLYEALVTAGFNTFRDDDELERGENINFELQRAIQDSKCSVIVFSKDYASSRWCLEELVMILERKRTSDHVVLPVFYDIDPSDVRKQKGKFAEAFVRHEERFKGKFSKVSRWRKALGEAADLAGLNLQNQADRHEAKFIKKIVVEVENKLRSTLLSVTPDLVGIDSQLESINMWLKDGSTDAGILLICGIPGIGKTTIAKSIYNSNINRFEGCAFLENVSEVSGQPDGLVNLQSKLLSILTKRDVRINNVSEGTRKITDIIRFKRVILVLDDVDHMDQLNAILGWQKLFYGGSKIIITTRKNDQLLKARDLYEVHMVKPLDEEESLKLFSRHAFGQDKPIEHYEQLSKRIIDHCEGLPLALKILGSSSLSWKNIDYWESAIEKLKDIPNGEILKKLKLSYDALADDHDQNLFLDIACFFIGEDKDSMVTILDGCNFQTKIGIQNLENRYLITTDENNLVRMHNLLRDMGREIIRKESPKEPGERSRLWKDMDSYNVLMKQMGEKTIEGIVLHRRNIPPISSYEVVLETTAFAKMYRLKLLILSQVQINGSYESFPKDLRWLSWGRFHLNTIPNDFPLESLVALDMHYSNLRQVWEVSKCLPVLKILNLSHSYYLTQTPDFSLLPKLEKLILNDCGSLVDVHESVCTLKLLETLDISGCSNLIKFPLHEFHKMESLKVFHADGTPINRWLNTMGVAKAIANPWPQFLIEVNLSNCNLSDDDFPWDFSNLSSLQLLDISKNQISRLPDCIKYLSELNQLSFWNCEKLQTLLGLPRIKEKLNVSQCHSLEKVTFQSATCTPPFIGFTYYQNLVEFEHWFKLEPIENVVQELINILELRDLECLRDIYINIPSFIWAETKRLPIQGIHEHGIFNVFLPGSDINGCSNYRSRDSTISFHLPMHPIKIQGLNISILYVVDKKLEHSPTFGHMTIQVNNSSKGLKWIYRPTFFGYVDFEKVMKWLSHWKFGDQLEGGDEVTVSIFVDNESDAIKFQEFGVHVVYKQEENMIAEGDVSVPLDAGGICECWRDYYEVRLGIYFLMGGPSSQSFRNILWILWENYNNDIEKEAMKNMKITAPKESLPDADADADGEHQMVPNHSSSLRGRKIFITFLAVFLLLFFFFIWIISDMMLSCLIRISKGSSRDNWQANLGSQQAHIVPT